MSYNSNYQSGYAPSAPPAPESHPYAAPPSSYYGQTSYGSHGCSAFPPGTHPEVIRSFQMVDRDRSGFIDDRELQQALSSGYQRFSLRTIRLIMFLFKSPSDSLRIGPKEFAALWSCLGQWRAIFGRFDRDRSGKIDAVELRDALYSLGCGMIVKGLTEKFKEKDPRYTGSATLTYDTFMSMIIPFLVS